MNRRSFFKFLGIGAATAVVAPTIVSKLIEKEKSWKIFGYNPFRWTKRSIEIPGVKVSDRRVKAHKAYINSMDSEIQSGEIKRNG